MRKLSDRDLVAVKRAIPVVEMFRKGVCGYHGVSCDCKFGYDGERKGEQTGCPELRIAAGALNDYEKMFDRLMELERNVEKEVEARLREKLEKIIENI